MHMNARSLIRALSAELECDANQPQRTSRLHASGVHHSSGAAKHVNADVAHVNGSSSPLSLQPGGAPPTRVACNAKERVGTVDSTCWCEHRQAVYQLSGCNAMGTCSCVL